MTDPSGPTFRDFATEIFGGNIEAASSTLATLLALAPEPAREAAEHFRSKMADPAFMPKAMSLRTAVQSPDEAATAALLTDCFGLDAQAARASATALRARYA